MADSDGSPEVTIAVLGEKLDNMDDKLTDALKDAKDDRGSLITLGTRVTQLEERTRIGQWLQGIATAISTGLGIAFGPRS